MPRLMMMTSTVSEESLATDTHTHTHTHTHTLSHARTHVRTHAHTHTHIHTHTHTHGVVYVKICKVAYTTMTVLRKAQQIHTINANPLFWVIYLVHPFIRCWQEVVYDCTFHYPYGEYIIRGDWNRQ